MNGDSVDSGFGEKRYGEIDAEGDPAEAELVAEDALSQVPP